jgi:hypothetical protein
MKLWNSYGSEHSADLVMIGRFKDEGSAEKAMEAIEKVTDLITTKHDDHRGAERFSEDALRLLKECKVYDLAPYELEQFIYGVHPSLRGDRIEIRTNEPDLSAFMKLMVDHGARVEVWCSRDYPESAGNGEASE